MNAARKYFNFDFFSFVVLKFFRERSSQFYFLNFFWVDIITEENKFRNASRFDWAADSSKCSLAHLNFWYSVRSWELIDFSWAISWWNKTKPLSAVQVSLVNEGKKLYPQVALCLMRLRSMVANQMKNNTHAYMIDS